MEISPDNRPEMRYVYPITLFRGKFMKKIAGLIFLVVMLILPVLFGI